MLMATRMIVFIDALLMLKRSFPRRKYNTLSSLLPK